jgi:hypothetical protein
LILAAYRADVESDELDAALRRRLGEDTPGPGDVYFFRDAERVLSPRQLARLIRKCPARGLGLLLSSRNDCVNRVSFPKSTLIVANELRRDDIDDSIIFGFNEVHHALAIGLLSSTLPKDAEALVRFCRSDDVYVRRAAVWALSRAKFGEDQRTLLSTMLKDPSASVRAEAVRAVGVIGAGEFQSQLEQLEAEDSFLCVRDACRAVLTKRPRK